MAAALSLLAVLAVAEPARAPSVRPLAAIPADSTVRLDGKLYNLADRGDLARFARDVDRLTARARAQHEERKSSEGEDARGAQGGRYLGSKESRRCLSEMQETAQALLGGKVSPDVGIPWVQEIAWAFGSAWHTPWTWRRSIDLGLAPFQVRDLTYNAVGRGSGRDPATELVPAGGSDLSRADPRPSPFWSRPYDIAGQDLYHGFDRGSLPLLQGQVLSYDGPHKGYGVHPSFHATWKDTSYKLKLGEMHTEPFGTRIFWALGFPTSVTDYVPDVRVRYDRRILSDFNSRKGNVIYARLFGLTLAAIRDSVYHDPFTYVRCAALKDGSRIDSAELRRRLFGRHGRRVPHHPETRPSAYNAEFEKQIDYLGFDGASVRPRDVEGQTEVGFWDYNAYNHPKRRELRGMGLLHAWLDSWDVRWGNNRVILIDRKGEPTRMREAVTDLGTLFGTSAALVQSVNGRPTVGFLTERPNAYAWAFTRPLRRGQTSVPIRWYMPMTKVEPFYQMNIDDARWMARLISQLTENQLRQALIAAGWQAPEARLLLEKLISRRDQMVRDLGLAGEVPLLRPGGTDRRFGYDPKADGPFEAALPDGGKVAASDTGEWVVVRGSLRKRADVEKGGARGAQGHAGPRLAASCAQVVTSARSQAVN